MTRAVLRALLALGLAAGGAAFSADALPPPAAYFNDYAGLVSAADAQRLDARLRQFAEATSTQVVVAVFKSLPSPSLEDFTVRTAESWRVGRKDWDNGAVLFVFVDDRKMRIETGYGLEGALPDQLAARILDNEVRPRFRAGDWAPGEIEGHPALRPPDRPALRRPLRLARGALLARHAGRAHVRPRGSVPALRPLGRGVFLGQRRGLVGRRRVLVGGRRRLLRGRRLLRRRRGLEQLVRRRG